MMIRPAQAMTAETDLVALMAIAIVATTLQIARLLARSRTALAVTTPLSLVAGTLRGVARRVALGAALETAPRLALTAGALTEEVPPIAVAEVVVAAGAPVAAAAATGVAVMVTALVAAAAATMPTPTEAWMALPRSMLMMRVNSPCSTTT